MLWSACIVLTLATVRGRVSDSELRAISSAIWNADFNRINDVDYNQGGSRLFNYVDEDRLNQSTYLRVKQLREYYIPEIGVPEPPCTGTCQLHHDLFLNELMNSAPMQIARRFLARKGLAPPTYDGFRTELRQYLFTKYSRSCDALDSSGFEHIMFGEIRNSGVIGFHSWLTAYLLEQEGAFAMTDYQRTCDPDIARFGFTWSYGGRTYVKSITSLSIGSSPEAEIALYILCFQARTNRRCPINIDNSLNTIQTHAYNNPVRTIGTAHIVC